jgi:hypothetical protein
MNDTVVDGAPEAGSIGERSKTVVASSYWDTPEQTVYPHGYAIHARCWEMVERFMKQHDLNGQLVGPGFFSRYGMNRSGMIKPTLV